MGRMSPPSEHVGFGQYLVGEPVFRFVQSRNIPLVTYSSRRFRRDTNTTVATNRLAFDQQVMDRLKDFQTDLCVLAGYMLIAGAELCQRYPLINLHPALPNGPIGTWREVIWDLISTSANDTGAMIHHATQEVDHGPPLTYCSFPIQGKAYNDLWQEVAGKNVSDLRRDHGERLGLFQMIRQEGIRREQPLLVQTLLTFSSGYLRFAHGNVIDAKGTPPQPICLNTEVETRLALPPINVPQ